MLFFSTARTYWPFMLGLVLTTATNWAVAQEVPPRTPVYPPPAPRPTDSTQINQPIENQKFAVPSVLGMGPSKGLVAHLEGLSNFSINTKITDGNPTGGDLNASTTVTKNRRAYVKVYIPALNRPHLKLILGLNYNREEFKFRDPDASVFYRNLEDKGLKVIGAQLAAIRPVDDTHWYIARVKGELNGDYTASELDVPDYLKMSAEFIYGWKRSPLFAWGVGLQLGYTFGRQSIYPVLLYNRTFNEHWGVESLFPARVTLRYNVNEKTLLLGGYTVDGFNYNIKLREPLPNGLNTLILRENEIKPRLRLEREIYDFLWFGLEAGYRYNSSFNSFDKNVNNGFGLFSSTRARRIDNSLGGASYLSVELFLVPPRKLLKKLAEE